MEDMKIGVGVSVDKTRREICAVKVDPLLSRNLTVADLVKGYFRDIAITDKYRAGFGIGSAPIKNESVCQ